MVLMNKKTILVFIDWYVPGYKAGGPIKSVHSMVSYLKNEFNFLIITSNTDFNDPTPYSSIKSNQWTKQEEGVSVFYASGDFLNRKNILQLLSTIQYDIVYLNSLYSLYFSLYPLFFHKKGDIAKPVVLAPRGMLGEGALKLKSKKKKIFLIFFKLMKSHKKITWHATSDQEKRECINVFGSSIKVEVVPNLQYSNKVTGSSLEKKKGELKLLFLSRISEKKNILFALEILMKIQLQPDQKLIFDMYGPIENHNYWEKCMVLINQLRAKGYEVEYKGAIQSEFVPAVIGKYHFLFLPTLNENYGHVIVESFVAGRPVIISDQTPWNHLEKQNVGWDIDLNNSAKFESVIEKCLLMSDDQYKTMITDAKQYATEFCNSDKNANVMKLMFENIIENAKN